MNDRRAAEREVSLGFGRIWLTERDARPCNIVDRSDTGMRIAVHKASEIPDRALLEMFATGETFNVEVAWRFASEIGVKVVERVAV